MSNSSRKQNSINLITNLLAFVINAGINFFLTPYLLEQLGTESYGFIGLANDFVGYASIVTVALNALAGRYITISFHKGDYEEANKYFNSVTFANAMIAGVMAIISVIFIFSMDKILSIPSEILWDVKLLFIMKI